MPALTPSTGPPLRPLTTSTKPSKRHNEGTRPLSGRSPKSAEAKLQKGKKRSVESGQDSSDEGNMSFLQFCPTCEQQIFVPSNSVLYCSEQCRREDCGMSPPQSPLTTPHNAKHHPHIIVPPLSPTQVKQPESFVRPATSTGASSSSSVDRTGSKPKNHERTTSEAANYLSQFQSDKARSMRPRSGRNNTSAVPSLSNTPSSASSSVSQTPSSSRERTYNPTYPPTSAPNARSMASRSIDLVLPTAQSPRKSAPSDSPPSVETITSRTSGMSLGKSRGVRTGVKEVRGSYDEFDDDDVGTGNTSRMSYEKRKYGAEAGASAKSSLKTLLGSSGGSKIKSIEREREKEKFAAAA